MIKNIVGRKGNNLLHYLPPLYDWYFILSIFQFRSRCLVQFEVLSTNREEKLWKAPTLEDVEQSDEKESSDARPH